MCFEIILVLHMKFSLNIFPPCIAGELLVFRIFLKYFRFAVLELGCTLESPRELYKLLIAGSHPGGSDSIGRGPEHQEFSRISRSF